LHEAPEQTRLLAFLRRRPEDWVGCLHWRAQSPPQLYLVTE
jgi:hypothetical protein